MTTLGNEVPIPADASASKIAHAPVESEPLPPLNSQDFKVYNRLAEHMDLFHNHFRAEWNTLHTSCTNNKRANGQSIRAFIGTGMRFCEGLEFHHGIEERHVFPMLARKMPEFRKQEDLIAQHRQIHAGLERMEAYLTGCERGENELRLGLLKEIMDSFGEVLWKHLDQEVETLGAPNMRKYWTKDEMMRLRL